MPHVSLITLGVDDLARATAFYEAWGWVRSSASVDGEVTFLVGGTVALALWARESLAEDAGVVPDAPGEHGNVALAMNVPSGDDVDAAVRGARDAGGEVARPPAATPWGGYSAYVCDPEGHLWEVAHNPGFPLRDDGSVVLPT